jgi:E-phenylitaconyl-CoA hydratase
MAVIFTVEGGVATLCLNRPEALNAIDGETQREVVEAFAETSRNPDIKVLVVTGAGEKSFCTGMDLKKTMPPSESFASFAFGAGDNASVGRRETDKPVICAINGYALGGGLELALACDIRICSENASFGLTEVRVGSIPGGGGTQRLPRIVGLTNAMYMLLTGDRVDSAEALRMGLVSRVVPREKLMEEALAIAARIAGNAPLSVRAVKKLVKAGIDMPLRNAIDHERYAFGLMRDTEDRIEGRKAFAEKRPPEYKGR